MFGDESTYSINLPEDTVDAIIALAMYYGNNEINEHALAAEKFGLWKIQEDLLATAYGNIAEERLQRMSSGHNFM